MDWFKGLVDVNSVRAMYRKLAMLHHPDRGGDQETMKRVNLAYEDALKSRHGETMKGSDGEQHTYHYNETVERDLMEKIAEVLKIRAQLTIDLVGVWLWVSGDTKPVKEELKAAGFLWHSKRVCWYYRKFQHKTRYNERASLDDLKAAYGSRTWEGSGAETGLAR